MKYGIFCSIIAGLFLLQIGCSTDPENQPRFRVKNDRAQKVNLQIKTSGGNTININDVAGGQTTDYRDVAAGLTEISAVIQNEAVTPTGNFVAQMNQSYTVVVANTTPPTIVVNQP